MRLRQTLSFFLVLSTAIGTPISSNNTAKKRYAILDNDWGAVGFLPILLAMKGNMEVLGLVSGSNTPCSTSHPNTNDQPQIRQTHGRSNAVSMLWQISSSATSAASQYTKAPHGRSSTPPIGSKHGKPFTENSPGREHLHQRIRPQKLREVTPRRAIQTGS